MNKNKIIVFGSYVVDLMSRASHLPAPGETVKGDYFKMGPGGKGFNQGVAAHKAGSDNVDVLMVTKLGEDFFADIAINAMKKLNMDQSYVFRTSEIGSGTALILVDKTTSENSIMVVSGACGTITREEVASLDSVMSQSEYLLTQLETNLEATYQIIDLANKYNVKIVLNTAPVQPISDDILRKVDIITPNEVEAAILSGIPTDTDENIDRAVDWFFSKGVKNVVITLGSRGAYVATAEKRSMIPAFEVKAIDTTGAGDAFNGGLVAALAEGKDLWSACVFANVVGALSVQKIGTTPSMPTRDEIDKFIAERSIQNC